MSFFDVLTKNLVAESRKLGVAASDTDFHTEKLQDEIRELRRELKRLSRSARQSGARALDQAEDMAADAVATAKKHPAASTLALFAAGFLVVQLFRNR